MGSDRGGGRAAAPPDLAVAAEQLRSWLDDLTAAGAGEVEGRTRLGSALAAWQRAHAGGVIAAALALEQIAVVAAEGAVPGGPSGPPPG